MKKHILLLETMIVLMCVSQPLHAALEKRNEISDHQISNTETPYLCDDDWRIIKDEPVNLVQQPEPDSPYYLWLAGRNFLCNPNIRNYEEAFTYIGAAALMEYPPAQADFGAMFELGYHTAKDPIKAVYFFRKAALNGDPFGMHRYARHLKHGIGCDKDLTDALTWFKNSAETGYAPAQNDLAVMLSFTEGVAAEPDKAIYWAHKAAQQGYILGIQKMGFYHFTGFGTEKNLPESYKWFALAAKFGDEKSSKIMTLFKDKLTDEDIENAMKWVTNFSK